jgi:oxygen-independent coproporphyrinogen-3 oxidase
VNGGASLVSARIAGPPPVYHCQEDGMIGLGVGARSYTRRLHYSQEWAVGSRAVRGIIDDYSARSTAELSSAHHGFELSPAEERRRHAILSLLSEGLDLAAWTSRFGTELAVDLPELRELEGLGLARREGGRLVLTAAGLERSDVIGPWLHSPEVDALMHGWDPR